MVASSTRSFAEKPKTVRRHFLLCILLVHLKRLSDCNHRLRPSYLSRRLSRPILTKLTSTTSQSRAGNDDDRITNPYYLLQINKKRSRYNIRPGPPVSQSQHSCFTRFDLHPLLGVLCCIPYRLQTPPFASQLQQASQLFLLPWTFFWGFFFPLRSLETRS